MTEEERRLVCLLAAIIIAGEHANPTLVNPSNSYQYNASAALNAARDIVAQARLFCS
jgi:hypothetical protein